MGLYVATFAAHSYKLVEPGFNTIEAAAATPDLKHLLLFNGEEWASGVDVPVSVTNEDVPMSTAFGNAPELRGTLSYKEAWQAVSDDGSRVFMTVPWVLQEPRPALAPIIQGIPQIYVRINTEQKQSPLANPEAQGTGTLTQGSSTVTSLVAALGVIPEGGFGANQTSIPVLRRFGQFVVGEPVSGPGIAPGTTITSVTETGVAVSELGLSQATLEASSAGSPVLSEGPAPFQVGQPISGDGIPPGTTVTGTAAGSLTLSAAAAASDTAVELNAGGGCTVAERACTVEVSASQRLAANPAGPREARYWGASADGDRVFFTGAAELTEDAYTGPDGNGANLYEYRLSTEAGKPGKLTDLSVEDTGNGASVLGVSQISEDGSYIYFVAEGAIAGHGTPGKPNLYVSHEGGPPTFIATLTSADEGDWTTGDPLAAGPETSLASISPEDGATVAFPSHASLTGYDNTEAAHGDCGPNGQAELCSEIYLYDSETATLACASCNPSGTRPQGPAELSGPGAGANLGLSRPRDVLQDGAVFFNSYDALTPHALAGHRNVYEYKTGHIYAVSNAAGGGESTFMEASPSGTDVFIASAERLVGQDTGSNVAVYDARIDGGFPAPTATASCESGDTCKPAAGGQPAPSGAAAETFTGPSNTPASHPSAITRPKPKTSAQLRAEKLKVALKACRRYRSKSRRTACEKAARKKYGVKAGKSTNREKPTNDRKASR